MLVPLSFVLWLSINIVAAAPPMARPGCRYKCGNVTIPYPFGIGSSCYYNEWYEITCNTSSPVLTKISLQVREISLGSAQVRVNAPMIINCTFGNSTWTSTNLGGSPYTFSAFGNVFAPVNCATTSFFNGMDKLLVHCGSVCDRSTMADFTNQGQESMCLTYPPFSLSVYNVNITRSKGTCSYVFLVDSDFLEDFDLSQSQRSVLPIASNGSHIPVVLDWVYNYFPSPSLNGSSSYCSSVLSDGNYRCSCPVGQGGNPYLPNGCQESPRCQSCKGECYVNTDDFTDASCYPSQKSRARLLGVVLGLSVGIGSLFVSLGCYWLRRFLKRRKDIKLRAKNFKQNGGLLLQKQMHYDDGVMEKKVFTVRELELATDHFNENRILGQGGQGTVYKGMLTDGRIIAVKKSKKVDESQLEPFINEVVILSQINHRNVVKLLGCCLETEVPLLVYEFIPNGTLSQHIHYPSEEFHISWRMRLQIAAESAGAIAYLHSSSSTPIYHRDIKSSNILLDDKYRAKVSDFGTSRTIMIDQTHLTTQVQGTFGYLDPEYFQSNQFTEKSDVYSFGVVLVELLSSKKPISPDKSKLWRSLATEFLLMMEDSRLLDILDPQVSKEAKMEELMAVANLAKECLNLNGRLRPTMKEVAMVLEGLQSQNVASSIQQSFPEWNQVVADVSDVDTAPFSSSTFSSHEDDALILHI